MRPPRILLVHNRYQQRGGEDAVVEAEHDLLVHAGYAVDTLFVDNDAIGGAASRIATAITTTYNPASRRMLRQRLRDSRPDIVHVHNFFPRLTPSIFAACREEGVPAVLTLHNYRLACANGLFFRDGGPCEACIDGNVSHAVRHCCYRGSRAGSAAVAAMIGYHRLAGTWHRDVARFIVLTEFARDRMIAAGLPADRMRIKPNFVPDPGSHRLAVGGADPGYALFVGRLSVEKGVDVLLRGWHGIDLPLHIVGDGPEHTRLSAAAPTNVTFLGQLGKAEVAGKMAGAAFLIVPSIWYEGFPMIVVEAMALGTPLLVSAIGGLRDIVADGREGRHFVAGDATDLNRVARQMADDPQTTRRMGENGRRHYLDRLSPGPNLDMLDAIYSELV